MSKIPSARKKTKKAVQSPAPAYVALSAPSAAPELSYDLMLIELEAIVSEANVRQVEEESSL